MSLKERADFLAKVLFWGNVISLPINFLIVFLFPWTKPVQVPLIVCNILGLIYTRNIFIND